MLKSKITAKWRIKNEFKAHNIINPDERFVVTVKSSPAYDMFVTGTNHGEVKLWDLNGFSIATINQNLWPKK